MPQSFQVLKCAECEKFQVKIKGKSEKWKCTVCNTKQSIIKIYTEGPGLYCRKFVQTINTTSANKEIKAEEEILQSEFNSYEISRPDDPTERREIDPSAEIFNPPEFIGKTRVVPPAESKWAIFEQDN